MTVKGYLPYVGLYSEYSSTYKFYYPDYFFPMAGINPIEEQPVRQDFACTWKRKSIP